MAEFPIVALIANTVDDARDASLAGGMNAYISKPVEPDALCELVLYWLRKLATMILV